MSGAHGAPRAAMALAAALALTLAGAGRTAQFGPWAPAALLALYAVAAWRFDRLAASLAGARGRGAAAGLVVVLGAVALAVALAGALFPAPPLAGEAAYGRGGGAFPFGAPVGRLPVAAALEGSLGAVGLESGLGVLAVPALAALAIWLLGPGAGAAYLFVFVLASPAVLADLLAGGERTAHAVLAAGALALAVRLTVSPARALALGALVGLATLTHPVHLLAVVAGAWALRMRGGAALAAPFALAALAAAAAAVALHAALGGPPGPDVTFAPLAVGGGPTHAGLLALGAGLVILAVAAPGLPQIAVAPLPALGLYGLGLAALLVPATLLSLPVADPAFSDRALPVVLVGGLFLAGALARPRAAASPDCDLPRPDAAR